MENSYKDMVHKTLNSYKCKSKDDEYRTIPIFDGDILVGFLKPVTYHYKQLRPIYASLICKWREENPEGFTNRFKGTEEKTRNWIDNVLLPREDRILFMVHNIHNIPIGHLGFSSFDFDKKSCEIDNVVRGIKDCDKGMMSLALNSLIRWGKKTFGLKNIYLKVVSNNHHAINFYRKRGFEKQYTIPLHKREKEGFVEWVEDINDTGDPDKWYLVMKLWK
jgi:perosamine synthetase